MSDTFKPYSFVKPSAGGLNATNRPNPYGLRAYPTQQGYGGEMMPKDIGWMGEQQGKGREAGQTMTEFSLSDEKGDYPSLVPTLTQEEMNKVLQGVITPEIDKKAKAFRDWRVNQGLSPFFNSLGNK